MKLLSVELVTDCDYGSVGDFDFGVPSGTVDWLDKEPGRRKRLAEYLRLLAFYVECEIAPFEPRVK